MNFISNSTDFEEYNAHPKKEHPNNFGEPNAHPNNAHPNNLKSLIRDQRILVHAEQHGLRFVWLPEHEHRRARGKSGWWSDRLSTCAKCWTSLEAVCTMQHDQGEAQEQAAALGQVDPLSFRQLPGKSCWTSPKAPYCWSQLQTTLTKVSFLACVAGSPTTLKCFTSIPKHADRLSWRTHCKGAQTHMRM